MATTLFNWLMFLLSFRAGCRAFTRPVLSGRDYVRFDRAATIVRTIADSISDVDGIQPLISAAVLKISYDGASFSGWSASDDPKTSPVASAIIPKDPPRSRKRQRNRGIHGLNSGRPRSVEGIIQSCMSKLFGNVDPRLVVVEGWSPTDKGVHNLHMVALVYCLTTDDPSEYEAGLTVSGKRLPHPTNSSDLTCFRPLRVDAKKLGFTLNRMLPPDVRILQAADMPNLLDGVPFHPTLSCLSKTYHYSLSTGTKPDPIKRRFNWYVGRQLDENRLKQAAAMLMGEHECNALHITVSATSDDGWLDSSAITLAIKAEHFDCKMTRFIVGCMVGVATDRLDFDDLQAMLETGQRHAQFEYAPAKGLVLTHVDLTSEIHWQSVNE
eukprot:CAMPEP_0198139702 /NCGR_PEP_ID=MMETSP1443-20131203/2963_1 /TAXON_ID=186043 /ORGANISM="Entomoneis sp., Strain CCMP2396" /LENGTH=381 /DNA_ID=CAMNT_0043801903 /DNA_START=65 /DNA_END=1210 /DNA_ORIENTATION=-